MIIPFSHFNRLVKPDFNKYSAIDLVKAKNPELMEYSWDDTKASHMAIPMQTLDGWYIAFVAKTGDIQISTARCFKVDAAKTITNVGEYEYEPTSSFIASDVNPTNCLVGDPAKQTTQGIKDYLGSNPTDINTEDGVNLTKVQAKQILLTKNPTFIKDDERGLPPMGYYFYLNEAKDGWVIIRTQEGSGLKIIVTASCYEIEANHEIKLLGNYDANSALVSKVSEVSELDPYTCKARLEIK